jgi:hypothetical protein
LGEKKVGLRETNWVEGKVLRLVELLEEQSVELSDKWMVDKKEHRTVHSMVVHWVGNLVTLWVVRKEVNWADWKDGYSVEKKGNQLVDLMGPTKADQRVVKLDNWMVVLKEQLSVEHSGFLLDSWWADPKDTQKAVRWGNWMVDLLACCLVVLKEGT